MNSFYFNKINFFHKKMINFINVLEFKYHKYQTNGTFRYDHYKGKLLLIMINFVSFVKKCQSMFCLLTI